MATHNTVMYGVAEGIGDIKKVCRNVGADLIVMIKNDETIREIIFARIKKDIRKQLHVDDIDVKLVGDEHICAWYIIGSEKPRKEDLGKTLRI